MYYISYTQMHTIYIYMRHMEYIKICCMLYQKSFYVKLRLCVYILYLTAIRNCDTTAQGSSAVCIQMCIHAQNATIWILCVQAYLSRCIENTSEINKIYKWVLKERKNDGVAEWVWDGGGKVGCASDTREWKWMGMDLIAPKSCNSLQLVWTF